MIRLNFFTSNSENKDVQAVVKMLNDCWLSDITALNLLDALAEHLGPQVRFEVLCEGDYDTVYDSDRFWDDPEEASKETWEHLRSIIPSPKRTHYKNAFFVHGEEQTCRFLMDHEIYEMFKDLPLLKLVSLAYIRQFGFRSAMGRTASSPKVVFGRESRGSGPTIWKVEIAFPDRIEVWEWWSSPTPSSIEKAITAWLETASSNYIEEDCYESMIDSYTF